jgi:hypothetical protein
MSTNSSVQSKSSRYTQGGITEVGPVGLEWWNRFNLPLDPNSDSFYTVDTQTERRIDKIAIGFYNDPTLWWIIAQYNNILDPYTEIEKGRVLYIPSRERVDLMMTNKIGGIESTRSSESILPPLVI